MLDKIKAFLSGIWKYIIGGLGLTVGILLYFLNLKHKEVAALKAEIDLVDTQRKADILEVQIKQKLEDNSLLQKEVDEYQKSLVLLQNKRDQLTDSSDTRTDKEKEDYWNK